MYYVYVLQSLRNDKFYIGYTRDLRRRIEEHKSGKSHTTKRMLPIRLIFYESYLNKTDAIRREYYFKTSKGKTSLRLMLKETLK